MSVLWTTWPNSLWMVVKLTELSSHFSVVFYFLAWADQCKKNRQYLHILVCTVRIWHCGIQRESCRRHQPCLNTWVLSYLFFCRPELLWGDRATSDHVCAVISDVHRTLRSCRSVEKAGDQACVSLAAKVLVFLSICERDVEWDTMSFYKKRFCV